MNKIRWARLIEGGVLGKIPEVVRTEVKRIIKRPDGYLFDLHIKLLDGWRGTCEGCFIDYDFIADQPSENIALIYISHVKSEIKRKKSRRY